MAKDKSKNKHHIDAPTENIAVDQKITETLENNYMPYAMSVIISRAIPEIDGFKPSHRKLLYTMYKMGLLTGAKTKSANVVGQTMKLNPHGDQAIYETLVRLTRGNEALLHPVIDSKGNFGKQYSRDMRYAASRYTEVKLDKICEEIFSNIDKDTVEFMDNYDGSMKEPMLLPVTFPNVLINPNQGIAVGMASNFCSFNLTEVCEATIAILENHNVTTEELMQIIKAPDFSTGGQLIYHKKEMLDIFETGRGGFKVRAKYTHDKKNSIIEISEIPYSTTSEAIMDTIADLVKSGRIKDIVDMRDETDLNGLKITLDVRRSTEIEPLMNKLFKLTSLEDTFSCNFNLLIHARPKVLGVRGIINEWIAFRSECVRRQANFDIKKMSEKLHLLQGLQKILLDIDKAIRIVRETEEDALVVPNLMTGFSIDELQAEYVAEIKLRNLNKQYILNRLSEIENLIKAIEDLKLLAESNARIKREIVKQLRAIIKKYGRERMTEIISSDDVEHITHEQMIEDYNLKLFLTDHGYLKKIPLVSLRSNPEQKTKDDDFVVQEIDSHNKSEILFFSTKQNCYKMRIYDLAEHKPSSLGDYLNNVLGMEADERVVFMHATDDYKGQMLFGFENGKMSKVDLSCYATKTNRKKLINAFSDKSPVTQIVHLMDDCEMVAFSSINKVLIFNTALIASKTTKSTQGVQVLKSKKGSFMSSVQTISESGLVNLSYYRVKSIPGTGSYLRDQDIEDKQITLEI
ncbi:MAG: DNA topoisomerase (ATP-hydrolyzing) subunit A [Clostridia bacterium]